MSDKAKVALVNMPFSYSKFPSIQLGTLSALLKSKGTPVDCHHLNVRFAFKIGVPLYEIICEKRALFGEWLFSYLLFRDNPKRTEYPRLFKPVFEQVAKESGHPTSFFEDMATRVAPQFLTWALTAIDWGQYRIVGFTSTFDQNVASLTMAKLIKDLYPDVTIVFGGANYDGEMGLEYFRAFPFIDHVVIGEGEETFPALVRTILDGKGERVPNGVTYRQGDQIKFVPNDTLFSDFTNTGPPDYDDYYHLLAELGETARGLSFFSSDSSSGRSFMINEILFQSRESVAITRSGGVLGNRQCLADLREGKLVPDFHDEHLPLVDGETIHRGRKFPLRIIIEIKLRLGGLLHLESCVRFTASTPCVTPEEVECDGTDRGEEEGPILDGMLFAPEPNESVLDDVLGIRDRADELAGKENEPRPEFRETNFPIFIMSSDIFHDLFTVF